MNYGGDKLFLRKEKLYLLVNLRRTGHTYKSIALFFNCDYSSVKFQCRKYHIEPLDEVYGVQAILESIPLPRQHEVREIDGERINVGRSYKDYL
jgi:hypothetical protein